MAQNPGMPKPLSGDTMNETAPSAKATPAKKPSRLKKILLYVVAAGAVVFVGIQFVPVAAKDNPKVTADFDESPEVEAILRRACYDCHSSEVRWPWYSRVAPASWLVAADVEKGRKAFSFSEWPEDEDDRQFNREQAWEQVEEGEMPLWFYVPLHPEAKLTEQDLAILRKWGAEKEEEEEEEAPAENKPATSGAPAASGAAPSEDEE
jgi:hypothetical protein